MQVEDRCAQTEVGKPCVQMEKQKEAVCEGREAVCEGRESVCEGGDSEKKLCVQMEVEKLCGQVEKLYVQVGKLK